MVVPINVKKSTPLYVQVIDDIKDQIRSGKLQVHSQIAPHIELARRYNVSTMTIKTATSALIRDGYLYARVGMGTFVADSRNTEGTRTIGLVLNNHRNTHLSGFPLAIEKIAYKKRFSIVFVNTGDGLYRERQFVDKIIKLGVKGFIVDSLINIDQLNDILYIIGSRNIPFVCLSHVNHPNVRTIESDQEYSGYLATHHLLNKGYTKIGFLKIGEKNLIYNQRHKGILRAIEELDRTTRLEMVSCPKSSYEDSDYTYGFSAGKKFSKIKDRPNAVIICNDPAMFGFQMAISETGLKIPDDVAIIGFEDYGTISAMQLPVTYIRPNVEKIAQLAIETIFKGINNEQINSKDKIKPNLIIYP